MEQLSNEFKAKQFADLKYNSTSYAWNVAYESYLAALITEQNFRKPACSEALELLQYIAEEQVKLMQPGMAEFQILEASENIKHLAAIKKMIEERSSNGVDRLYKQNH